MIDPQPPPRTLLQFFPPKFHLLRLLLLLIAKRKQIVLTGVIVDKIEPLEELRVALDITPHDVLHQFGPYLKVAILFYVVSSRGLIDFIGEGDHLVECPHDIR